MSPFPEVAISGAVEGPVDEATLTRLIEYVGADAGPIHGKNGKPQLRRGIAGYNNAARFSPWAVLVDLDDDFECAPPLVAEWVSSKASQLCFRVVKRAVEAWLLADAERVASFLRVPRARVPQHPETLGDPKRAMVDLARHSRGRQVRQDMVPRPGSGRSVRPAYTSRMIEFVTDREHGWRPDVAARSADSLARCIRCLRRLVEAAA